MRSIGNLLWHIPFLGFLTSLGAFLLGGIFMLTVIGAPLGLGLFEMGKYLLAPYSKALVSKNDLKIEEKNTFYKIWSFLSFIIYLPFGLILLIMYALQGLFMCLSIIGIPMGIVILKTATYWLNPINKICVPIEVANKIAENKANEMLKKYNV